MKAYIFVIHIVVISRVVVSFNVDTKFPIIYDDPFRTFENHNESSYFGYSVVLYPGGKTTRSWIFIGAPRGDSAVKNSGVVFRCSIDDVDNNCQQFLKDNKTGNYVSINTGKYVDFKYGAWIGQTMDIHLPSGSIVVCGPRWINNLLEYFLKDYSMSGLCYLLNVEHDIEQKLVPLVQIEKDVLFLTIKNTNKTIDYYKQGLAGFSAHFSKSKKHLELLLGVPNTANGYGSSVMYRSSPNTKNNQFEKNKNLIIPDISETTGIFAYSYSGYQVTSGYFFGEELYYVMGSPRHTSVIFAGQITIFNYKLKPKSKTNIKHRIEIKQTLTGSQTGEYFGSVLASGDINGDSLDDLLVGAPYYSTKRFNEGRVYIFLGSKSKNMKVPTKKPSITGHAVGGMFGSAITILGDINFDSYADVAISAPYEDDQRGVVYIYMGSKQGISEIPSQIIYGKSIALHLRGFGLGLSTGADVDENGYTDIAIGAYLSGHTIILRGQPVVKLEQTLRSSITRVDYLTKGFTVELCYWFVGKFLPKHLSIFRLFKVDQHYKRNYLLQVTNTSTDLVLEADKSLCETVNITLKNLKQQDKNVPIEIVSQIYIAKDQINRTANEFCKTCPILNASSNVEENLQIPIKPCGDDSKCDSYLEIKATFSGLKNNEYVIDESTYLRLEVNVVNSKKPAYATKLQISLPPFVVLNTVLRKCDLNVNNSVTCKLQDPLQSAQMLVFAMRIKNIDREFYEHQNPVVYFNISVSTISENINKDNSTVSIPLNLKFEADLTINGNSENNVISHGPSFESNKQIQFTHVYELQKYGPSPIDEALMEIYVPTQILNKKKKTISFLRIFEVEAYQTEQPFDCFYEHDLLIESNVEVEDEEGIVSDISNEQAQKRRKRSLPIESTQDNVTATSTNRTLFLNCSAKEVTCIKISCRVGPLEKSSNTAKVSVKMILDAEILSELMDKKDIIYFSTDGKVEVITPINFMQSGNLPDYLRLSNEFFAKISKNSIDIRIIVLSSVSGLLILSLIITGLSKGGFFQRNSKIKLQELKEQTIFESFSLKPRIGSTGE